MRYISNLFSMFGLILEFNKKISPKFQISSNDVYRPQNNISTSFENFSFGGSSSFFVHFICQEGERVLFFSLHAPRSLLDKTEIFLKIFRSVPRNYNLKN